MVNNLRGPSWWIQTFLLLSRVIPVNRERIKRYGKWFRDRDSRLNRRKDHLLTLTASVKLPITMSIYSSRGNELNIGLGLKTSLPPKLIRYTALDSNCFTSVTPSIPLNCFTTLSKYLSCIFMSTTYEMGMNISSRVRKVQDFQIKNLNLQKWYKWLEIINLSLMCFNKSTSTPWCEVDPISQFMFTGSKVRRNYRQLSKFSCKTKSRSKLRRQSWNVEKANFQGVS